MNDYPHLTRDELLAHCIRIVRDLYAEDIEPSLRKVYYDLVGEGLIKPDAKEGEGTAADRRRSYRRVGETIVAAKESGEFPLEWLRDELRIPNAGEVTACYTNVQAGLRTAAEWLRDLPDGAILIDRWYGQPVVPIVVVEKDAIVGTIRRPVTEHEVHWFCLRGYPSWTGVYSWFEQLAELHDEFSDWDVYPTVEVLYAGDHDPDGMQIPFTLRDTITAMREVSGREIPELVWTRLALTMEQARTIGAPSMGVKRSSSRAPAYIEQYGLDAWEIEAMPAVELRDLVDREIANRFDLDVYRALQNIAEERREELRTAMDAEWFDGIWSAR